MSENSAVPYEGMEPYVFVSYSYRESEKVHEIIDVMRRHGYRVEDEAKYTSLSIPTGGVQVSFFDALSHCAVFMCFISHRYVQSEVAYHELTLALREKRPIISVLLEDIQLQELPDHFSILKSLQWVRYNNSSESDFIEQLNHDPTFQITRIRDYESDSQEPEHTNSENAQECKVIFLGDGAAGKSSLIERMVNHQFKPGSLPTEGVKMTKWETNFEGRPFVLHILDFGGQEIMHSMHRCFLTSHTVYVVVCESRDDTEIDSVAARWLETVKAFAPDCPVILALNKADLNANVSVNEKGLKERNPCLTAVLRTSAAVEPGEEYGVNGLLDAIWKEIPGCINRYEADADMLGIKREIEDMKQPYITAEEYQKICVKHHITESGFQRGLLNWFKDLGVAYFYEPQRMDTLVDSVRVLSPAWLTNGIYRLILRTSESGFLPHKEIKAALQATHEKDVLPDIVYTPRETEYILHVMEIFEISHDMGDGREMIPLKMSKTPPDKADLLPKKQALHLRWEGAYLPNNVIHRLMIRKFPELDTDCVWRTGGQFQKADSQCTALAEMNEKTLDVYVTGDKNRRKYYMESFRDEIRMILVGLHIHAEEIICYRVKGKEGHIPYDAVMDALEKGNKEIYIYDIKENVSPKELIREVYPDLAQERERYRMEQGGGSKAEGFDHVTAGTERIVNILLKVGAAVLGALILLGIANPTASKNILDFLKALS